MTSNRGFTLLEMVVYVALFAAVGGLMTGVFINSANISGRESANTEVVQQLNFVMGTVQKLVSDASLVEAVYKTDGDVDPTNDPIVIDASNDCDDTETYCTLKLRFEADNIDPTWVVSSPSGIYLVRGDDSEPGTLDNATTDQLLTDKVDVDFLRFTKYEVPGGHALARTNLSLTYNTDNNKFKITRMLTSAVGRVTAATFDDSLLPNIDNQYDIGTSGSQWRHGLFSGNLTVGGTLTVNTSSGLSVFEQASANADAYDVQFRKARGTVTSPAAITTADELGTIMFRGYSGAGGYVTGAAIKAISEATIATTRVPAHLSFWTGTDAAPTVLTERMRIDKNGNVGIGTTNPEARLHIMKTNVSGSSISSISTVVIEDYDPVGLQLQGYSGRSHIIMSTSEKTPVVHNTHWSINNWGEAGTPSNVFTISRRSSDVGNWTFGNYADWTHYLTITPTGNIFIGGGSLNFKSSDTAEVSHYTKYSSTVDGLEFAGYAGFRWMTGYAGADERMRLTTTGLGIGMTPTAQLQLSTDSAKKPTTNTWTITSDERIKTDIRPFTDGLDVIMGINPVWYKYNGKGGFAADGKDNIGVIAQDVQGVAPYTISTYMDKLNPGDTQDTELLEFNSHAITFNLINAVKELKLENDALKARIEVLEASN